tara:strand:- start:569 stop:757 length:189 start_codon:yes stop_codon:yes gene_type:complete
LPVDCGLPNIFNSSSSDVTVTTEDTGPFWNAPAIAPIEVATAGTTFVKSISLTFTPGETKMT